MGSTTEFVNIGDDNPTVKTDPQSKKKKGFFSRFRRSKRHSSPHDRRELTPSPTHSVEDDRPRDESPSFPRLDSAEQRPAVRAPPRNQVRPGSPERSIIYKDGPAPPAREAAFSGPPRFDWIDVESSAAVKIQSAFRRYMVMKRMEELGVTTVAIRNRRRRRKAKSRYGQHKDAITEDAPMCFNFCALGLVFGDATEEGDDAYRALEKERYEQKQKEQQAHEEAIRKRFLKSGQKEGRVVEALEVVE